jgi:hypothetical protein
MSRDPLPCPPEMRNGGLPPADLSSSSDALLGPQCWLTPPQPAPEPLALERVPYVTTYTLALHNAILIERVIQLH